MSSTLTFITEGLPGYSPGEPYNAQIEASGGTRPYSFGIMQGTLPPGLTLSSEGLVSGTPTEDVGQTTPFIKVIDFVGENLTQAFPIQVIERDRRGPLD